MGLSKIMEENTRIEKDLVMFEDNLKKIGERKLSLSQNKTLELAKQYYQDAKYYLEKQDFFTAFGCINYAHGLLDSMIKY